MVFLGGISASKSPQVSRTFLSIMADLNNRWSPLLLSFPNLPVLVHLADCFRCTIYNWYHRHLHVSFFFISQARSRYLSLFSLSYSFSLGSAGTAKSTIRQVIFFCWLSLGLVVWPRSGDPSVTHNPWKLCMFHSPGGIVSFGYTTCSYGWVELSSDGSKYVAISVMQGSSYESRSR